MDGDVRDELTGEIENWFYFIILIFEFFTRMTN